MRVIAGTFKGRKLTSLKGDNTRPTSDKIKGSIFNMIGPYFDGGHVLDLYSGSGNLAIEAISRGCDKAYCFDSYYPAIEVINQNISQTKIKQAFVVKKMTANKAIEWLVGQKVTFDLVFLDPPYATEAYLEQLVELQEKERLNHRCLVVCEKGKGTALSDTIGDLTCIKKQAYGTTEVMIYRFIKEELRNEN